MKKTNIALAIFSAIALAACGGSSNDDAVDNSSNTGTVQPGINNGNVGTVQPGNNGNTNTNTGDTNTNTDDTNTNTGNNNAGNTNTGNTNTGNTNTGNTNTGNNNAGNTNAGNTNAGNTNAGNTNTGTTTPTKPTKPEQPKPPVKGNFEGATKIEIMKKVGLASDSLTTEKLPNGDEVLLAKPDFNDPIFSDIKEKAKFNEKVLVKQSTLLDDEGNLPRAWKTSRDNGDSTQVYYFDDGKPVNAYAVNGSKKLYRKVVGQKKADTKASLSADEIFVPATQELSSIKSYSVFGKELAVTANKVNKVEIAELNRGTIEPNKVLNNDIVVNLAVNGSGQKLSENNNNFEDDKNDADKTPTFSGEYAVKTSKTKAYNLPYIMVAYSHKKGKINNYLENIVVGTKEFNNLLFFGNKSVSLPENVKASYSGKAFTPDYNADFNMDVSFGINNAFGIKALTITNRGNQLPDLKQKEDLVQGNFGNDYHFKVNLSYDDKDSVLGAGDIKVVKGSFYGDQAANVAGALLKDDGNTAIGAFAAKQK